MHANAFLPPAGLEPATFEVEIQLQCYEMKLSCSHFPNVLLHFSPKFSLERFISMPSLYTRAPHLYLDRSLIYHPPKFTRTLTLSFNDFPLILFIAK